MHELSIAQSLITIMRAHVPADKAAAVREVRIRVGDLSGVLVESLAFCFTAALAGTPYASAVLTVDRVPGDDLHVVHIELDDDQEGTT